jgi:hypothetical protein
MQLENLRHGIFEEIRNYPRPVAGCDQQFNYLIEQRAKMADELERLERIHEQVMAGADAQGLLDEFLRSSDFLRGG